MSSINEYNYFKCFESKEECCTQDDLISVNGKCSDTKLEAMLGATDAIWTQFFIPEVVEIPVQKPDIEEVTSISSCVEIISQRVVKTPVLVEADGTITPIENEEGTMITGRKLVIEGILQQKIVYTANVPEQSIHSAHFSMPFSVFIILPADTLLSSKFKIEPCIEDIFVCRTTNRNVFKNTTIFIKATDRSCPVVP